MALLVLLVLVSCVATAQSVTAISNSNEGDRISAFKRCIAGTDLPQLNTSKPICTLSTTQLLNIAADSRYQQRYYFGCDDLMRFADYVDLHNLRLEELSFFSLNTTHSSYLRSATYRCYRSVDNRLCNEYDLCLTRNRTQSYTRSSCIMEFMHLVSHGTNGDFNEKIYTYTMAVSLLRSYFEYYYTRSYNSAITQHYLYTCMSHSGTDIENCILSLLDHCFSLEYVYYYYSYWCYLEVLDRLCSQFHGDENLRCRVLIETRMELSLERQCANEENEEKCENLLSDIIDQKPISQLNSSDVDQVKAVVAGSSQRSNYTNETLTQLNRIVEYFSLNESAVAGLIDKQDANTFLSVISTLASEDGTRALKENSTSDSGAALLHDLDEISKLIGSAVVTGNEQVEGNYAYNDDNIGVFVAVGSNTASYSSGVLKLNKTRTAPSDMTAEISIPPTSVCGSDYESSGSGSDDYNYYYDYPKECEGLPYCWKWQDGYWYIYYDLFTIFGDCSRKLRIPRSCPAVVTTSIADKLPLLLTNDLPSNTTIASLVLSSQIVMKNEDNSTSVTHTLKENATLNFKLFKPINRTQYTPKCYYWDTVENVWSDEGIETQELSDEDVQCTTNHLTSFAVLVDHKGLIEKSQTRETGETGEGGETTETNSTSTGISDAELQALSIVGYIGPSISLFCIIVAIIIMISLRKKMNTSFLYFIHLNLCISLLLALTVLILGLETADHYRWLCSLVAGLLHYLFLCVFAWMMAEGITLFVMVVYVWGIKFLKWQIFFPAAWGIPLFIVAISVGIRHELYGTNNYCWLSSQKGLVWAFLGPALAVAAINTVILIITVVQLVRVTYSKAETNKKLKNFQAAKSAIVGTIVLFPLLGITWFIGVFAVSQETTVFLWLFTIFNSLQGVFILLFHVLKHRAFLTWMARRCPCLDKYIEVHTSAEANRRISKAGLPILPPQRMLSARFGRQSSMDSIGAESQAFNLDLDDIAEEDGEENPA